MPPNLLGVVILAPGSVIEGRLVTLRHAPYVAIFICNIRCHMLKPMLLRLELLDIACNTNLLDGSFNEFIKVNLMWLYSATIKRLGMMFELIVHFLKELAYEVAVLCKLLCQHQTTHSIFKEVPIVLFFLHQVQV